MKSFYEELDKKIKRLEEDSAKDLATINARLTEVKSQREALAVLKAKAGHDIDVPAYRKHKANDDDLAVEQELLEARKAEIEKAKIADPEEVKADIRKLLKENNERLMNLQKKAFDLLEVLETATEEVAAKDKEARELAARYARMGGVNAEMQAEINTMRTERKVVGQILANHAYNVHKGRTAYNAFGGFCIY